ncbi:AAA family ATPase [Bradyrhizobium sp. S3.9.1]|uniref:AAA family ATPase n=1 Tax=Bradyrhizobium sp. S3.9.1 TaxID=3156431 RepID=UPI00339104CD
MALNTEYCEHNFPAFVCRRCEKKDRSGQGQHSGIACEAASADHDQTEAAEHMPTDTTAAAKTAHGAPAEPTDESASDPSDPLAPMRADDAGETDTPHDGSAEHSELTAAPLQPNKADIARHLFELFSPSFVHFHPDAWIEIAYGHPEAGGKPDKAKRFSVFEHEVAVEFAEVTNKAGRNVYVGVALRHGDTPRKSNGRASGENVLVASHAWAEFDNAGDAERIEAILRKKDLATSMTVVTGRTPHLRAHLYFKLEDRLTLEELKSANTELKTLLGSDDVQNADRVMRLAGTINHPTKDKQARGYIPELVTLDVRPNAPTYRLEELTGFAAGEPDAPASDTSSSRGDDLQMLLEASVRSRHWHNSMRSATARMVGRGWTDDEIKFACGDYCQGKYGDADLKVLIDGARKKFNRPNPERTATQQMPPSGIKLEYYADFSTAVAKDWIIKGVIAKGETSSWVGPPGVAKSALLVDLMTSAASGVEWRGHRSKGRVGVVYFALERGQLVKRRLVAHAMRSEEPLNLPIAVANQVVDLMRAECVSAIVQAIRTAEAHYGVPVGLIVIDTYNKGVAAGGGDENSAKDQNTTLANLRRVQEQTGAHVALVGHTGKDEAKGARGSNAQLGDVDLMVQLADADGVRTATIIKSNDGAVGVLTVFKLDVVVLDQDEDGDDIMTAIVAKDEFNTDKAKSRARLNKSQRRAMEMLERAINDVGKPGPLSSEYPQRIKVVTVEQWRETCWKGGLSPAGTKESADKAFRRAMADLGAMHRIGTWDGLVWIAYE